MTKQENDEKTNAKRSIDFAGNISDLPDQEPSSEILVAAKQEQLNMVDVESQSHTETRTEVSRDGPTRTIVTELDVYGGSTLEERIDSFIACHPVVMFNKTWCLFSVDAQEFLIHQLGVSVHCIEVDIHPQGNAIIQYIQKKTKHDTVPIIYIKGELLGGFEDVNALYATGRLENEYLKGLTQADRCEEFMIKSNASIKPLFWFPETVNAHVVRIAGILTSLASALSAVAVFWQDWGAYLAYALCLDFILRLFTGSKLSPMGQIATILTSRMEPKPRHGRPKQFATMCGLMFSGLGSIFFLISVPHHEIVGAVFMGGLACASGMEGFLDFCLGCVFFKYGIKFGLIPK